VGFVGITEKAASSGASKRRVMIRSGATPGLTTQSRQWRSANPILLFPRSNAGTERIHRAIFHVPRGKLVDLTVSADAAA
jgi:hypothetical protein